MDRLIPNENKMREYKNSLYYKFLPSTKYNHEETRDLVQDGLNHAYEKIDLFDKKRSKATLETYLYKIAKHKIIDILRKDKWLGNKLSNPLLNEYIIDSIESDYNYNDEKYHLNKIKKIVNNYSPFLKEIFYLRYIFRFTYDEISVRTKSPVGTVKAKMFYLHNKLKEDYNYYKFYE